MSLQRIGQSNDHTPCSHKLCFPNVEGLFDVVWLCQLAVTAASSCCLQGSCLHSIGAKVTKPGDSKENYGNGVVARETYNHRIRKFKRQGVLPFTGHRWHNFSHLFTIHKKGRPEGCWAWPRLRARPCSSIQTISHLVKASAYGLQALSMYFLEISRRSKALGFMVPSICG